MKAMRGGSSFLAAAAVSLVLAGAYAAFASTADRALNPAPATTPDPIYATAESFTATHPNDSTPTLTKFAPDTSGDIAFRVEKILCDASSCSNSPQDWLSGVIDPQIRQASASSPFVHGANITRTADTTLVSSSDAGALYFTSTVPSVSASVSNVTGSPSTASAYGTSMPSGIKRVAAPSPEGAYAADMVFGALGASTGTLGSGKDLKAVITAEGNLQTRVQILDQSSLNVLYDATITSTIQNGALDTASVNVNSRSGVDVWLQRPQNIGDAPHGSRVSLDNSASFSWPTVLGDTGSWLSPYGDCVTTTSTFCLLNNQYMVKIDWSDFQGNTGLGRRSDCVSDESGGFWFFAPTNVEMITKVHDATNGFGHNWYFAAATTTVEYDITVKDTVTGTTKTYHNPLHNPSPAITDTSTFASTSTQAGTCVPSDTTMCKLNDRYQINVSWKDFNGNTGSGHVVASCRSDQSDSAYFFSPDNTETQFKMVDGCKSNDRTWFFSAATTNVKYDLFVTHVPSGTVYAVHNQLGVKSPATADAGAFATCSYSNVPGASSIAGASIEKLPIPSALLNQTDILNGTTGGGN